MKYATTIVIIEKQVRPFLYQLAKWGLAFLFILLSFQLGYSQTTDTLYVDASASGTGDGQDWTNAFTDLQAAINISNSSQEDIQIWLAKGTYRPTEIHNFFDNSDRGKAFYISQPVQIYGGFAGDEQSLEERHLSSNKTILTGDLDNGQDTALHVIVMEADTIDADWRLDGLTIRDGLATGSFFENRFGAGIYINTFTNNSDIISPLITNCSFINNYAEFAGGAYYSRNNSTDVNATSRPEIYNCIFSNNTASDISVGQGGALYVRGSIRTEPKIRNTTFFGNESSTGGAIYFQISGIVNPSISNSIFWNNIASKNGDDIYVASSQSGGAISHSILGSSSSVSAMFSYKDTLLRDPMFKSTTGAIDLRLLPTSPAINAGINDSIPDDIMTDLAGNPRIQVGRVDMGAYEGVSCDDYTSPILYVDSSAILGGETGLSWTDAFTDLQVAINVSASCGSGKQIWVADGTYRPTQAIDLDDNGTAETKEKSFYIDRPMQIYGGFSIGNTMLSQRDSLGGNTILTGDLGNNQDTSYHVMSMKADSLTNDWIIDGLRIQDGRAISSAHRGGGGIYARSTSGDVSIVIKNCTFSNNTADIGGGVFLWGRTVSSSLTNCTFSNNLAFRINGNGTGGGVYISADTISSFLTNCSFISNSALGWYGAAGGGVYFYSEKLNNSTITNCIFKTNSVLGLFGGAGGGLYFYSGRSYRTFISPTIANCIFDNNSASFGGGIGAFASAVRDEDNQETEVDLTFINCTIANNLAITKGGGVYIETEGSESDTDRKTLVKVSNCIFRDNTAPEGPDIWKNNSHAGFANGTISHSILSSSTSVEGMITTYSDTLIRDPLFVDAANHNLQLSPGSPAFNTGDNTAAVGISQDFAGNPRIELGTVDMGAYEYQHSCNDALRYFLPGTFSNTTDVLDTHYDIEISSSILGNSDLEFSMNEGMTFLKEFEVEAGSIMEVHLYGCD